MNRTLGIWLVVYSLLIAGLSYLTYQLAPGLAQPTLITGLLGGALCLVWGIRAVAGSGGKALPILTLIPVSFALLPQTVAIWSAASADPQVGRTAAVVTALLLVLSVGMLVRIAWSGMVFDVPPASPAPEGMAKAAATGKRAAPVSAATGPGESGSN